MIIRDWLLCYDEYEPLPCQSPCTLYGGGGYSYFSRSGHTVQHLPEQPASGTGKMYQSGWDWGPTLPDMGIFRSVELRAYDTDRLDTYQIRHINGMVIHPSQNRKGKLTSLLQLAQVSSRRSLVLSRI